MPTTLTEKARALIARRAELHRQAEDLAEKARIVRCRAERLELIQSKLNLEVQAGDLTEQIYMEMHNA